MEMCDAGGKRARDERETRALRRKLMLMAEGGLLVGRKGVRRAGVAHEENKVGFGRKGVESSLGVESNQ